GALAAAGAASMVKVTHVGCKETLCEDSEAQRVVKNIVCGLRDLLPQRISSDPNCVCMSQSSAWVGLQIQRSIDGGKSLAPPEHKPYQERQAVSSVRQVTHGG